MKTLRLFASIFRWDLVRELRRKDTLSNMALFALIVLFVAHLGIGNDRGAASAVGPVVFWISILFSGTVGLSQTFAAEREGGSLGGITTAPIDLGVFYLAKAAATWLYVYFMSVLALAMYAILFDFWPGSQCAPLLAVMGGFTLAYVAIGVVLAAMTTSLRGAGEVLLRILLFPLMIPLIWLTLRVSETVFDTVIAGGAFGPRLDLASYLAAAGAFDAIYLASGYLLFPKVLEE